MLVTPPKPKNEIPKWLVERYTGQEKDIVEWWYGYFYHQFYDGHSQGSDVIADVAAGLADAKLEALVQTDHLIVALQDAQTMMQLDARDTEWFREPGVEIQSYSEILELSLTRQQEQEKERDNEEGKEHSGMYYERANYIAVVSAISRMAEANRRPDLVVNLITGSQYKSKIRESGPVLNRFIKADIPETQKLDITDEILKEVVNTSISVQQFRENNRRRLGKIVLEPPARIPVDVYMLGGKDIIVIESDSPERTRAIESILTKTITEVFMPRDVAMLMSHLENLVKTKGRYNHYKVMSNPNDSGELILYHDSEGLTLPTKDEFRSLCLVNINRNFDIIDQALATGEVVVPLYDIKFTTSTRDEELEHSLGLRMSYQNDAKLNIALAEFYTIPAETRALFSNRRFTVNLFLSPKHILSLTVNIS